MAHTNFGAGFLYAIPAGANPTPKVFGAIQDTSVDWAWDSKPLHGQFQGALEQFRGKLKMDLKVTMARMDANLFNSVVWGQTLTTGEVLSSLVENGLVAAGTFTVANSATFATDLGIINKTTGKAYTRVASAPAAGQYSVAAGVYTVPVGDNGVNFFVAYTYTSASTGATVTGTNPLMGSGVIFRVVLTNVTQNVGGAKTEYLTFPAVQCFKLAIPQKLDDITYPQLDMSAQDDGAGNLWTWSNTL